MVLVFSNSFYFILVDLIWESVFLNVSQNNFKFEEKLYFCIVESFQGLFVLDNGYKVNW